MSQGYASRREFMAGAAAAALAAAGRGVMAEGAPAPRFKKSLKIGMLGAGPIEDRLRSAKDAGFDSVEPDTVFDKAELAAMIAASKKVGIGLDAVICSTHWSKPLSDPDPKIADETMKAMVVSMENAKAMGGDMVLLVPAVVKPGVMYRDCWTRSAPRIKELAQEADRIGVTIGIENVWNKFLLSPLEMLRYLDEIGHARVQSWFDIGNIVLYGYPQDWIRTLGPRIARVDIKDFNSDKFQFVEIGRGSIDFPEVMRAFDEIGYKGVIAAEVSGGNTDYLTRAVSRPMDEIFAGRKPKLD